MSSLQPDQVPPHRLPLDVLLDSGAVAAPVAEAAAADVQWLHYLATGRTRTGLLTISGVAVTQRETMLDPSWSLHVGLGHGRAAFQRNTLLTVGQVHPDGTWSDIADNHQAPLAHSVHVVGSDMLLSYLVRSEQNGYLGVAVIGRVRADGTYTQLSEPYLWDFWTHIVPVQDGLVFFYNQYTRFAATGRVTGDGGFANLVDLPGFDAWTRIVAAADGTLIFHNTITGAAASGRVEPDGGFTNLHSATAFLGQWHFLPAPDGRLVIIHPEGALVARMQGGWFVDAQPVAGQLPPPPFVFVR